MEDKDLNLEEKGDTLEERVEIVEATIVEEPQFEQPKKEEIKEETKQETKAESQKVVIEIAGGSNSKNGKAVASLVLGIVSLVFLLIFPFISPVLGIIGIVLGVQSRKELEATPEAGRSMATAGMVCSIVALVLSLMVVACTVMFAGAVLSEMAL